MTCDWHPSAVFCWIFKTSHEDMQPGRFRSMCSHPSGLPSPLKKPDCFYLSLSAIPRASQVALGVKNLPANAGDVRDLGSIPGLGRSPGVGNDNPLQIVLLGESHGQRSLEGYGPWGHKELDRTEAT